MQQASCAAWCRAFHLPWCVTLARFGRFDVARTEQAVVLWQLWGTCMVSAFELLKRWSVRDGSADDGNDDTRDK